MSTPRMSLARFYIAEGFGAEALGELDRVLARRARLIAAVDLFKALGGGWREAEAGASAGVAAPIRRADDPPPTPPLPRASAG